MNGDRIRQRGAAAVEFALVAPVLLLLLGGVTDFGGVMAAKSQLANGLAQGVQYALLIGPSVSGSTVQGIVRTGAANAGLGPAVSITVTGPACFCPSGSPVVLSKTSTALSATYTCTSTCPTIPNQPVVSPQAFMMITASFTYSALMPLYSHLASPTVSETVTVKLQ